jgi:hypothetical protein
MKRKVFVCEKSKCGMSLRASSGSILSITSGRKVGVHEVFVGPCFSSCPLYREPQSIFYHLRLIYNTWSEIFHKLDVWRFSSANLIEIWNEYIVLVHTYTYVYAYICTNTYMCICICLIYVFIYVYRTISVYAYIHTNVCIYNKISRNPIPLSILH